MTVLLLAVVLDLVLGDPPNPARLAALAVVAGAGLTGASPSLAWRAWA